MNIIEQLIEVYKYLAGNKDNAIILASILSFVAALFLVFVTRKYVMLTKSIADINSKSLKLTHEKEIIDRTLNYISSFEREEFIKLLEKKRIDYFKANFGSSTKRSFYELYPETIQKVEYFINYFDTLAILYFKEKVDKELFGIKIEPYIQSFALTFKEEIIIRIKSVKDFDVKIFYWFRYLVDLVLIILKKERKQDPEGWRKYFEKDYKDYGELLNYAEKNKIINN